jgi:predicted transcriptional regulator
LGGHQPVQEDAYTSVATIMRIMLDKGTIRMVEKRRPQRFAANLTKADLGTAVLDDLCEGIFAGSLVTLLRHALSVKKRTPRNSPSCATWWRS